MLGFYFFNYKFFKNIQSGFFMDFLVKKITELLVRNLLIYLAKFFAEKYGIEVLTRKLVDSFIFKNNKYFGWYLFNYSWFFYFILGFIFYFISIINLISIFF